MLIDCKLVVKIATVTIIIIDVFCLLSNLSNFSFIMVLSWPIFTLKGLTLVVVNEFVNVALLKSAVGEEHAHIF